MKFKLKHVLSVLILGIAVLVYYKYSEKNSNLNINSIEKQCVKDRLNFTKPLKYKVYGKNPDDGHLKHVFAGKKLIKILSSNWPLLLIKGHKPPYIDEVKLTTEQAINS